MLNASEIWLTAQREFRRILLSIRGLLLVGASFLIGAWFFVMLMGKDGGQPVSPIILEPIISDSSTRLALAGTPMLFVVFWVTVKYALPTVILLLGSDVIAGDIQHRTIRYRTVRATRPSLLLGSVLGVLGVATAILLLDTLLGILIYSSSRPSLHGPPNAPIPLGMVTRMFFANVVFCSVYVALTAAVGTLVSSATLSLVLATVVSIGLFTFRQLARQPDSIWSFLDGTFAGSWEERLLSNDTGSVLFAHAVCIAWTVGFLAIAWVRLSRRDL